MRLSAALIGLLVVLSSVGLAAQARTPAEDGRSCSVPCGYITPILVIDLDTPADGKIQLEKGEGPKEISGTVTFMFDIVQEGFGVHNPTEPITVQLSLTNKPDWVTGKFGDDRIFEVPINPVHIEADSSNPTQPGAVYRYSEDITFTLEKNDNPIIVEPGEETVVDMGLYARSTESGLYKPAYGYRKMPVEPDGYPIVRDRSKVDGVFTSAPKTSLGFHNVRVGMDLLSEVRLWRPTEMVFKVVDNSSGQTVLHPDMWVTVVDQDGEVLYNTGSRHPHNGLLRVDYTFPDVGRYNVLVSARPTPGVSGTYWEPVTTNFPIVVRQFGDATYPSTYNASYKESLQTVAGDAGEPAEQYRKTIPFPVRDGAGSSTLHVDLQGRAFVSPQNPDTFPSRVQVDVVDPDGDVVGQATVDPSSPTADTGFDPSTAGEYEMRLHGVGVHPIDYGVGATLALDLHIPYSDPPKIRTANVEHPTPGVSEVQSGPVTFTLDHGEIAPWKPTSLSAAVDAPGEVLNTVVTVTTDDGHVLYTEHRFDGTKTIDMDYVFPKAGRYLVHVSAQPVPGSGASWQAQAASFPVVVGPSDQAKVTYPSTYQASYDETVLLQQGDTARPASQYDRYLPFPVFRSAESAEATVTLTTPTGSIDAELLTRSGARLDEAQLGPQSTEATLSPNRVRPGEYVIHIHGTGAAGTAYTVDASVGYGDALELDNPLVDDPVPSGVPDTGTGAVLPGFQALIVLGAAAVALAWFRRKDP